MFGLDDQIAALSTGQVFLIVAAIAALLGLRHATDPDHLTAVSTLVAGQDEFGPRRAGRLGFSWGLGHATTLFLFGLPIVLFDSYLPGRDPNRCRGGHRHRDHGPRVTAARALAPRAAPRPPPQARPLADSRRTRIGLIHGIGGSAGVGILLLAAIPDHVEGVAALALFAAFTAVSMSVASTTFGYALSRGAVTRRFVAVAPALGMLSLAFGAWYALGAAGAVPYIF